MTQYSANNDRENEPKWLFRGRLSILGQAPRKG